MKIPKFNIGDKVSNKNGKEYIVTDIKYSLRLDTFYYYLKDMKGKECQIFYYEYQLKK